VNSCALQVTNDVTEAPESLLLYGEQWNKFYNLKENSLAKLTFWWCKYFYEDVISVNLAILTTALEF